MLEAQQAGIAAVKPGVTMGFVNEACMKVLKEKGFSTLVRHGFCHFVGLEVHDVGDGAKPLVPGVVFTIEPGLYENATSACASRTWWTDGCEVSPTAFRNRAAIEADQRPGILDGRPRSRLPPMPSLNEYPVKPVAKRRLQQLKESLDSCAETSSGDRARELAGILVGSENRS